MKSSYFSNMSNWYYWHCFCLFCTSHYIFTIQYHLFWHLPISKVLEQHIHSKQWMGAADQYSITRSNQSKPPSYHPLSSCHLLTSRSEVGLHSHQVLPVHHPSPQQGHTRSTLSMSMWRSLSLLTITNTGKFSSIIITLIHHHSWAILDRFGAWWPLSPPISTNCTSSCCVILPCEPKFLLRAPHQSVHYWPYHANFMSEFNSNSSKGQCFATLAKS